MKSWYSMLAALDCIINLGSKMHEKSRAESKILLYKNNFFLIQLFSVIMNLFQVYDDALNRC